MLLTAKKDLKIMHQFPRGEELDMSVDSDPRAVYKKMLNYDVDAAMAIILKLITKRTGRLIKPVEETATHDFKCLKSDCITSTEDYLPPLFYETENGEYICKYCGQKYEAK
jgi:aspartate carbamoyltransferase catalytic subunit